MIESETYSHRVTKAVGLIPTNTFLSSDVAVLATTSEVELKRSGSENAVIVMGRMKCLIQIDHGGPWRSGTWQKQFKAGPECTGCHFTSPRNTSGCYMLQETQK